MKNKDKRQKANDKSSWITTFMTKILLLIVGCTLFYSCDNKQYQPKPRGYFRIDFAEKEYVRLDSMQNYSFEYSVNSQITPDYFSPDEKEWINENVMVGSKIYVDSDKRIITAYTCL